jgi:hypothetical protein
VSFVRPLPVSIDFSRASESNGPALAAISKIKGQKDDRDDISEYTVSAEDKVRRIRDGRRNGEMESGTELEL